MLSIVIVHWNTPDLLAACLRTIQDTAPRRLAETIIVDCASDNGDVTGIIKAFDRTMLIEMTRNAGYAAGCNAGARGTTSEIILFLNADTEILPGAVDLLHDAFDLNPRVGLVAPLLLNPDLSIQSAGYGFPGATNVLCDLLPVPDRIRGSKFNGRADPGNQYHPYAVDYALGAALAVRATALDDIRGWDESFGMYSEEVDLARRLHEVGWSRLIEPRARIIHHGGASTEQRPVEMQAALWRSRGIYHRRWSSPRECLILRSIVSAATRVGQMSGDNGRAVRDAFASGLTG